MDTTYASNLTKGIDQSFMLIMGIGTFFFVLLITLMIVFVIKYHRTRHPKAIQVKEKAWMELSWILIPLVLVIFMFFYTLGKYNPTRKAPLDAINIIAIGYMWDWEFIYPSGKTSNKLFLPLNKPVKLQLKSRDVVHSLYIPAYRLKEDMVPGKEDNYMWFIPTRKDTFDILCAEYCGVRHSYMLTKAIVLDSSEYNVWVANIEIKSGKETLPGLEILKKNSCIGCHSTDGSKLVGPSFKDLFGSERVVVSGSQERKVVADSTYIVKSIYDPDAELVKGYNSGLMRSYTGVISDDDIVKIIEYLKTPDDK